MRYARLLLALTSALVLSLACTASAFVITPTAVSGNLRATLLAGGQSGIDGSTAQLNVISAHSQSGALSVGTFTNAGATYGLVTNPGIILSTGDIGDYADGPNGSLFNDTDYGIAATAAQEALLDPITGASNHFDATQVNFRFDMRPGFSTVTFHVVFGSEEYPSFVNDDFLDGLGIFVNDVNYAILDGDTVNTGHPYMRGAIGTELNGALGSTINPLSTLVLTITAPVSPTNNRVKFIIADTADEFVDSTVYITLLPEPGTLAILGLGGVVAIRRRRASV